MTRRPSGRHGSIQKHLEAVAFSVACSQLLLIDDTIRSPIREKAAGLEYASFLTNDSTQGLPKYGFPLKHPILRGDNSVESNDGVIRDLRSVVC